MAAQFVDMSGCRFRLVEAEQSEIRNELSVLEEKCVAKGGECEGACIQTMQTYRATLDAPGTVAVPPDGSSENEQFESRIFEYFDELSSGGESLPIKTMSAELSEVSDGLCLLVSERCA